MDKLIDILKDNNKQLESAKIQLRGQIADKTEDIKSLQQEVERVVGKTLQNQDIIAYLENSEKQEDVDTSDPTEEEPEG